MISVASCRNDRIDICLATYNGAQWIGAFLASLDAQTYTNWRLVISDDYSEDDSLDLIYSYFQEKPEKLKIVKRVGGDRGVLQNFQNAIDGSDSKYVLLADQDDIWLPDKIEKLFSAMIDVERGHEVPALVFSDLKVVDEQLIPIHSSWWGLGRVRPDWAKSFTGVLCQNIVPGCAMMLNRRLLDIALPFPKGIIMHDWWFLLVCAAFGKVEYCSERLVLYRRHSGAHTYFNGGGWVTNLIRRYGDFKTYREQYAATVQQAQIFESRFGAAKEELVMPHSCRRTLLDYIEASKSGWFRKRWLWMRNGIHLTSKMRTVKFYISI